MSVDVAVVGTAQTEIEEEYWHESRICNEIFQTLYIIRYYEPATLSSITLSFLKVTYTVLAPDISIVK